MSAIASTKKRIHINKHVIASNKRNGTHQPVISIKTSKTNTYAHKVQINGPSEVIHAYEGSGHKPLSCGAIVWIETYSELVVDGELLP